MPASLPPLTFTVSATNAASGPLARVRGALAGLVQPATQVDARMSQLSRRLSAMPLRGLGRQALEAAHALREVSSPLGALTSAVTLGGLARMTSQWSTFGSQLGISSARLGTNAAALHSMQGAARLFGGTAEDVTQALTGFRETMTEAAGGRNNEAVGMLSMLGIAMRNANGEINKGPAAFDAVLDRIAKIADPEIQVNLMRIFRIPESMWNVARQGSRAFRQAEAEARSFGAISDDAANKAREFGRAQTRVGLALEGVRNALVERFAPAGTALLNWTADIIRGNRELASGGMVLAGLLAGPMALAAGRLALSFVGIGTAMRAVSAFRLPGWVLPLLGAGAVGAVGARMGEAERQGRPLSVGEAIREQLREWGVQLGEAPREGEQAGGWFQGLRRQGRRAAEGAGWQFSNERETEARTYFQGQGWTPEQAAGLVANLRHESGMRPDAVGDSGRSFGLAQWNGARLAALGQHIGREARTATFPEQLAFIQHELTRGTEQPAGAALRGTRTAGEAGAVVSRLYERPRATEPEAAARAQTAEGLARMEARAGAEAPRGEVVVRLELENAPPGTRARVSSSGNGVRVEPVRVQTAMPSAVAP